MKKIEDLINTYKDFPKKGVDFKDVLGILQDPEAFNQLIIRMSSSQIIKNSEAIISIDARGFIFGSAVSLKSSKPMIVARKPGKLPGEVVKRQYNLEYGVNSLSIQKSSLSKYSNYVIIDDLLATGGTVKCVADLLLKNGKEVNGLLTVIELYKLKGRSKFNFPVESMIKLWIKKITFTWNKRFKENIFINCLLKLFLLLKKWLISKNNFKLSQ